MEQFGLGKVVFYRRKQYAPCKKMNVFRIGIKNQLNMAGKKGKQGRAQLMGAKQREKVAAFQQQNVRLWKKCAGCFPQKSSIRKGADSAIRGA